MANRLNRATIIALILTICALTIALASFSGLSVSAAPTAADLSTSTKTVNKAEALNDDTLSYTIIISNSGDDTANTVTMIDTLPTGLTYVANSAALVEAINVIDNGFNVSGQQITWSGGIGADAHATIELQATIGAGVAISSVLTNSAAISDGTNTYTVTAPTQVVSQTGNFIYLPVLFKTPLPPTIHVGPVTSDGGTGYQWTVSWNQVDDGGTYEIQESRDSDFNTFVSVNTIAGLSKQYSQQPSAFNQFFYRVRYNINGLSSPWSNVVNAIGAYEDNFSFNTTGWRKVR
ncbi:MAG TPA: DUF11 domain-containing protein, partial [Anaerolineae bacterium]|nr:DUF11 domain-containing protein [Anaerolineae bacterium]